MIVWNILLSVGVLASLTLSIVSFILGRQNKKALIGTIGPELDKNRNEFKKIWSKL